MMKRPVMGDFPFERMDLIKIEMNLLQGRFDKYDDLIYRSRNWFMTLWIASIGFAFTSESSTLPFLAVGLSGLYYLLESLLRHNYWYKYVVRYRTIRDELNKETPDIDSLSVYDLTNKLATLRERPDKSKEKSDKSKLEETFLKVETIAFYGVMALLALVIGILLSKGVITFPQG